jgi:hypothetical protein
VVMLMESLLPDEPEAAPGLKPFWDARCRLCGLKRILPIYLYKLT